jgi:hypothetical protein
MGYRLTHKRLNPLDSKALDHGQDLWRIRGRDRMLCDRVRPHLKDSFGRRPGRAFERVADFAMAKQESSATARTPGTWERRTV